MGYGGALSLVGLAAWGGVSGFFGSSGRELTTQEEETIALSKFGTNFAHLSPIDEFSSQYVKPVREAVDSTVGNKGLLGIFKTGDAYKVGQTCLANTPYDVTPNGIRGVLVSGKSSIIAGISLDANKPDTLLVTSANTNLPELVFNGLGTDKLTPANIETSNELRAYGCVPGLPIASY